MNVDPFDSRLDDVMERERLRRVFMQGLDSVVGYVLPLQTEAAAKTKATGLRAEPALTGPKWVTGPWFFRDERMYLMPGDSPMGYRLPLDSVPWVSKTDYPYMIEADPFAPRDALPAALASASFLAFESFGSLESFGPLARWGSRTSTHRAVRVSQAADSNALGTRLSGSVVCEIGAASAALDCITWRAS